MVPPIADINKRWTTLTTPSDISNIPATKAVKVDKAIRIRRSFLLSIKSATVPAVTPRKNAGACRIPKAKPTMNGESVNSKITQPKITSSARVILPKKAATNKNLKSRDWRDGDWVILWNKITELSLIC